MAGELLEVPISAEQRRVDPDRGNGDQAVDEAPRRLACATTVAIELGRVLESWEPAELEDGKAKQHRAQLGDASRGRGACEKLEHHDLGDGELVFLFEEACQGQVGRASRGPEQFDPG
jgi:hypothetical protein